MIPLWFDIGYRTGHFYLGAYVQTGFVKINYNPSVARQLCIDTSMDCTMRSLRVGLDWQYSFLPDGMFDPWFGTWIGSERETLQFSVPGVSDSLEFNSIEYLGLQAGLDFHWANWAAWGPYVSFSFSEYDEVIGQSSKTIVITMFNTNQKAWHEWLTFGVRGSFDWAL
jgi:hypothetical protein